jgi:acetate kinase
MKILALNTGSSTIKYAVFDAAKNYQILVKGIVERIGQEKSAISHVEEGEGELREELFLADHRSAMQALGQILKNKTSLGENLDAVGHRIVHGEEKYREPILINEEVVKNIKEVAKFAPLHCDPNIIGVEVLQELFPNLPQVAIFDTAAYASVPPKAFLYGVPMEYYEKYKIRKYGFHGINHSYVAHEAAKILTKPLEELKVITCHLGSGCSISAFENGRSIDNSMGLTPLEGLVMGTRSGDLDPAVVIYLIDALGLQTTQLTDLLNKHSGLFGLCGKNDMRDIIASAANGDRLAQTAIEVFVYRIQKYIGAFIAALNGVDVIVFTAGIGENSSYIRAKIAKNFSYSGALLDKAKNETNETIFSSEDSAVLFMTIPANEEKAIAQQTSRLFLGLL